MSRKSGRVKALMLPKLSEAVVGLMTIVFIRVTKIRVYFLPCETLVLCIFKNQILLYYSYRSIGRISTIRTAPTYHKTYQFKQLNIHIKQQPKAEGTLHIPTMTTRRLPPFTEYNDCEEG